MERLLRSKEMAEIDELIQKAYDFSSKVVYFPVRHHSPACSFHLKNTIEKYEPDLILIEGPSDANELIKHISHEESKAPLCIYYSYSDSKKFISESEEKYMCYYPFLDYSPELVALREARKRNIKSEFIDLNYAEILINSSESSDLKSNNEKNTYSDEYLLQRSKFIIALCEKEGCRSYNELWEKLFEIDGIDIDSKTFVKNMIASCYLSRIGYSKEMLEEDGCSAREEFMAYRIKKAAKEFNKILVVTGGFHTSGLIDLVNDPARGVEDMPKLHTIPEKDIGAYAMVYSFEESDQLSGYASGMPHPAFYQKVWDSIIKNEEKPYESTVLDFIIRCGGQIRKKEGGLSTADEIEAYNMAKGLKSLRNKKQCGVYELQDAIKASFIKGELNISTDAPLKYLNKLLKGRKIGSLCEGAEVPPIVKDFRQYEKAFRLKADSTAEQEIVLDVYKNKKHREISKFFHIMRFLNTGFCKLIKGPDFVNRKNTNLVREIWKYKWSINVESTLIELSVQGGTLNEAASSILNKKFKEVSSSGDGSLLLIHTFMMGLENMLFSMLPSIRETIINDGTFYSVVNCTYNLCFLYNARSLLNSEDNEVIKNIIIGSYNKSILLIQGLSSASKDEEDKVISKLKDIYYISRKSDISADIEIFEAALIDLMNKKDLNSAIEGAAAGLLFGMNKLEGTEIVKITEGYFYGSGEKLLMSASFLKGLFSTAREIVFNQGALMNGIDNVIRNIDEEEFLKILPDIRLSFSFFTPQEIDKIGKEVAEIYGITIKEVLELSAVNEKDIKLAGELDSFGRKALTELGLLDVLR